jgi:hypothetical protein
MIARSATTSTSGNDTADDSAGYDGHSMGEVIPIIHKSCNEKLVSENQNYL